MRELVSDVLVEQGSGSSNPEKIARAELKRGRNLIDQKDLDLMDLLDGRFEVSEEMAGPKSDLNESTQDTSREVEIINKFKNWARERGYNERHVADLVLAILRISVEQQSKVRYGRIGQPAVQRVVKPVDVVSQTV